MRNFNLTLVALMMSLSMYGQNVAYEMYIQQYKEIAIEEMHRTGMPASVKLAQGLIESNAGRSDLARSARNHFGIKCGGSWSGGKFYKKDDDYDSRGRLIKSCFRKYDSVEDSYTAQSEFLRDPNKQYRYGFLFKLDPTDYRGWAHGLLKAGYATNPRYAQLIIKVIEQYGLDQYDRQKTEAEWVMDESYMPRTFSVNDVEYVLAESGDTPKNLSMDFGVSIKRILKYNENLYSEDQVLSAGTRVFLQKKRNRYRGKKKYHYVKAEETMFTISQEYGVSLNKLYKKNKMEEGTEPAIGERIKLRGLFAVSKRPTLRSEKVSILPDAPRESMQKDEEVKIDIPDDLELDDGVDDSLQMEERASDGQVESPVTEKKGKPTEVMSILRYTVKKGDSLYKISREYDTSVERIIELNDLKDATIHPGDVLKIEQ